MGQTLGRVGGDLFSTKNDTVNGTGQSVGDLKKIGYTDQDVQTMGGAKPGTGVALSRGLLKGALSNLPQPRVPQASGYTPIMPMMPSPVVMSPNAAFYGG